MKRRLEIKARYSTKVLPLKSRATYVDYPNISVVFKNPETGVMDAITHDFLIDTGASICIVNSRSANFLKTLTPIDEVPIVYGSGGAKPCPVYKIIMIMSGREVLVKVAFDDRCNYQVLGHYDFFEKMKYSLFDSYDKKTLLVKDI